VHRGRHRTAARAAGRKPRSRVGRRQGSSPISFFFKRCRS
jgi:hypothetical protein